MAATSRERGGGCHVREALALRCGPALAGPGWHVRGAADMAKLDSLRPAAIEHRTEAEQGGGRHAERRGGSRRRR
ncbi:hypothetical protein [Nonomuraea sp. B19D2]|uniref:hypothetical protein n=1 Tax=Nonomuraea sp. B19D2 TaxID=3159561 RepID=UPI0032D9F167